MAERFDNPYTIHHRLLSRMEERDLFIRVRDGDKDAADLLVKHNQRLVYKIANDYKSQALGQALEMDDLVSEGNRGLIRAIQRFDIKKGMKLSTYATYWIKHYIRRYCIQNVSAIYMPVRSVNDMLKPDADKSKYHAPMNPIYLDNTNENGTSIGEMIASQDNVEEMIVEQDNLRHVICVIQTLPAQQRKIIIMHMGLDGSSPMSYEKIAVSEGIEKAIVKEQFIQAIQIIKASMGLTT